MFVGKRKSMAQFAIAPTPRPPFPYRALTSAACASSFSTADMTASAFIPDVLSVAYTPRS